MSLTAALHTGKSAMLARQTQMSVIGSNVARADQEGYHREVAILVSSNPLDKGNHQIGTGTHVEKVVRQFDAALESNLQNSLEQQSYFEEYNRYLKTTELVMAHEGESMISEAITLFSNSTQGLANDPESQTHRRSLLANAARVSETFNQQHSLLVNVRDQIASSDTEGVLPERVGDLNELAIDLAQLNDLIFRTEQTFRNGQQAIDFRDQRDLVVKDMAKLADITVVEDVDGNYDVSLGGRAFVSDAVVDDTISFSLSAVPAPVITWDVDNAPVLVNNGSIEGLVDAYNFVQARITDLETYATEFTDEMNAIQAGGFDINGTAGTDIFSIAGLGNMTVIMTDPGLVAASDNATNSGDGDNALAMFNQLNAANVTLGNDSLRNRADKMVDEIALEKNRTDSLLQSATDSVAMFTGLIQDKSGVSIEEEMINMLEVQRAFQGSAKFISAVDQLLQTVINLV